MKVRAATYGVVFAGAMTIAGCESKPATMAPVSGRVTFAGAPVVRGVIVFSPDADSGTYGACATGEIGANGSYSLTTDGTVGATPGWHRVTVASLDGAGPRLPDRFRDPVLSKLRAEVVAGRENILNFKLEGP